ncbi:hypothetical protein Tco_0065809 [Tanacetum coccineum]
MDGKLIILTKVVYERLNTKVGLSVISLGLLVEFFELWRPSSPVRSVVEWLISNCLNEASTYRFRIDALKVLRHLKGSPGRGLRYSSNNHSDPLSGKVVGFSDANWAKFLVTKKSIRSKEHASALIGITVQRVVAPNDQHKSLMAHTTRSSPSYQSSPMTYHSPAYQSAPTTNPSSSYNPHVTHPTPNIQFALAPSHSTSNQSSHMKQNSPANQFTLRTHGSTTNQYALSSSVLRGRGKNKCYWEETETQLLIEVLQDMACDPLWKTDVGFRSNYMGELIEEFS